MATTSIPLHELVGDNSPPVVLDLMAGLVGAALARDVRILHPAEVVIGRGARVNLMLHRDLPPHPLTSAPELRHAIPGSATLVYAVGALGALATLGHLVPAPIDDRAHADWLKDVCDRLSKRWGPAGAEGVALIRRCLDRDPSVRPRPDALIAEVRAMGFPSEQGLVSRTGFAPPSLEGQLPLDLAIRPQGTQTPPPAIASRDRDVEKPRVRMRPPRTPPRTRPAVDPRWVVIGIGVVLFALAAGAGVRLALAPDPPAVEAPPSGE